MSVDGQIDVSWITSTWFELAGVGYVAPKHTSGYVLLSYKPEMATPRRMEPHKQAEEKMRLRKGLA